MVHGLAFASALVGFGFDGQTLALSLVGCNLGVDAMQLGLVIVTVPLLVVLSRGANYGIVRTSIALFGVTAALGWVVERMSGLRAPTSVIVEHLARRGPWLFGALLLMAIADQLLRRFAARHAA